MVEDFLIFNSKSLPFKNKYEFEKEFKNFIKILTLLSDKQHYYHQLKSDVSLENLKVFDGFTFKEILNKVERDMKSMILSFLTNRTIKIEIPIVKEKEGLNLGLVEYRYNNELNNEMGYVDMFNTFLISFLSSDEWETSKIQLKKYICNKEMDIEELDIEINNISKEEHLNLHKDRLEDKRYKIIDNLIKDFFKYKDKYFKNKIIINSEVEKSLEKLDKIVLARAITILYDLETENRKIDDYEHSSESETVQNNPNFLKERLFKFDDGTKEYVFDHLKSLPSGNRIYYLEKNGKIYICYIGPHLSTKKNK